MPRSGLRSMDSNKAKSPLKADLLGLDQRDHFSFLYDTEDGRRGLDRLDDLINMRKNRKPSNKRKNDQNSSLGSSKYKQLSISQFCSPSREKREALSPADDELLQLAKMSKRNRDTCVHNEKCGNKKENHELKTSVSRKGKVNNNKKLEDKKENCELKTTVGRKGKVDNNKKLEDKEENLELKTSVSKKGKVDNSKKLGEKKENFNHSTAEGKKKKVVETSNNKKLSEKNQKLDYNKKFSQKKIAKGKINKQAKNNNCNTSILTGWLSKSKDRPSKKFNALTEITESSDEDDKLRKDDKKQPLKRNLSESFIKYGIHLPSFEEMVAYQTKVEKENKLLDSLNLDTSLDFQDSLELNFEEPEEPEMAVLDCKELNKKQLEAAFECNYRYVSDIFHGIRYSVRHARFKTPKVKDYGTEKDLKYNTSMLLFTFEQKQVLLSQLRSSFDNVEDELNNNDKYYFQVLLPELCTKIFMDLYNMSHGEAVAYLDKRPV